MGSCSRRTVSGAFSSTAIDYHAVIPFKHRLLRILWNRFRAGARRTWSRVRTVLREPCSTGWRTMRCSARSGAKYNDAYYLDWPDELVRRVPSALAQARRDLANRDRPGSPRAVPVVPAGQAAERVRARKGVRLIGDLPFFVSPDSSDVWAHPELFLLDETPPASRGRRAFRRTTSARTDSSGATRSTTGTRSHAPDTPGGLIGCARLLAQVDAVRLDHFRGICRRLACTCRSARPRRPGEWIAGPGRRVLQSRSDGAWLAAVHCRRSGSHHSRCGRAARPVPYSGDPGPAIRLRRRSGQHAPARELRARTPWSTREPTITRPPANGSRAAGARQAHLLGVPAAAGGTRFEMSRRI